MTTRLLVSVRDASEARDAVAAGADLVDLKEPRRGSLGPVDPHVARAVVAELAGRVPLSLALGELLDTASPTSGEAMAVPPGVAFAKLGLARCAGRADWPEQLGGAVSRLPAGTSGVAVVYADARQAQSPKSQQIIAHAARIDCRAVLVDTCHKGAGGLLSHWSLTACAEFIDQVHGAGLLAVVAGSLDAAAIARLLPLSPDYVAVRGAVCTRSRTGRLNGALVRRLVHFVHDRRRASQGEPTGLSRGSPERFRPTG